MALSSETPSYSNINAQDVIQQTLKGIPLEGKELSEKIYRPNETFTEHVCFANCDFLAIDFSGSTFQKGLEFIGCVFKEEVIFESVRVEGDCHFRACSFKQKSRFDRLQVNGKLEMRAPRDKAVLRKNRHQTFLTCPYLTFEDDASFAQMRISGEANFGSVQFRGTADFYNAHVDGPAFFRVDYCRAYRETHDNNNFFPNESFPQVRFGEDEQGKMLAKQPFSPETRARFRDAYFGGELNFHGAIFRVKADFSYVHAQGATFFCFSPPQDTKVSCEFKSGIDFEGARFKTSLRLDRAKYPGGEVSFRDCRIGDDLGFGNSLPSTLLLTGCIYKRILGTTHTELIKAIEAQEQAASKDSDAKSTSSRKTPFDRSSWIQLEGTLRANGDPEFADDVYRARMAQEGKFAVSPWKRLANILWSAVSAYGTSTRRLVLWCILTFLISAIIFDLSKLQENQAVRRNAKNPLETQTECSIDAATQGKMAKALMISLANFSPIKLPIETECEPANYPGKTAAVFEKIIGFLLIPLLIANLAGLLNRRAKAKSEAEAAEE